MGQRRRTESTEKTVIYHQPLTRGGVESLASSCYQIYNSEVIVRPWCSQIDVYNSAHLIKVVVTLYSEGPASCDLLGALEPSTTLWVSRAEQRRC